ncbi:MAG: RidA family protein [Hyphomonadaceae bacterium]|nr:RidA family protein [Hyphomonadaceae bacterium]
MRVPLLFAALAITSACQMAPVETAASDDVRHYVKDAYAEAGFPFSSAVEAGGWVFLAGELGTTPEAGLVPGGIEAETRQTMDNIEATLAANGLGWDRVVKCTVFLADIAEWPTFNDVYKTYFDGDYPARSALGANGLALGARVEIECIAKR